jgi:histidine ammonia-lyase
MTKLNDHTVALRVADDDDALAVRRLAALDDAPPLRGEVLLALVDGEAVAATSLSDGRVVANPFLPTADTVTLLSLRAAQMSKRPARRRIPRLRAA